MPIEPKVAHLSVYLATFSASCLKAMTGANFVLSFIPSMAMVKLLGPCRPRICVLRTGSGDRSGWLSLPFRVVPFGLRGRVASAGEPVKALNEVVRGGRPQGRGFPRRPANAASPIKGLLHCVSDADRGVAALPPAADVLVPSTPLQPEAAWALNGRLPHHLGGALRENALAATARNLQREEHCPIVGRLPFAEDMPECVSDNQVSLVGPSSCRDSPAPPCRCRPRLQLHHRRHHHARQGPRGDEDVRCYGDRTRLNWAGIGGTGL